MNEALRQANVLIGLCATAIFLSGVLTLPILLDTPRQHPAALRSCYAVGAVVSFFDCLVSAFCGMAGAWARAVVLWGSMLSRVAACALFALFTSYLRIGLISLDGMPSASRTHLLLAWVHLAVGMMAFDALAVVLGWALCPDPSKDFRHTAPYSLGCLAKAAVLVGDLVFVVLFRDPMGPRRFLAIAMGISLVLFAYIVKSYVAALDTWVLVASISFLAVLIEMRERADRARSEQARALTQAQCALDDARVDVATARIQPHFLSNTLATIHYLCFTDPELAARCTEVMADHLRAMVVASSGGACVPVSDEMDYVRRYLELRSISSPNRMRYHLDLCTSEFDVPLLSVLTLVENAVDHGLGAKRLGGTVTVETCELDDRFEVRVSDDGVGFDPQRGLASDRAHVGLDNVRYRIERLCSGNLRVEGMPDEGARVTLSIPKGREADCEYRSH